MNAAIERGRSAGRWQFWIDRGGTFTDVDRPRRRTARCIAHKLLSENPAALSRRRGSGHSRPAAASQPGEPIPAGRIGAVKMGTTVATNALLERKGDRTLLVTTKGFRDALRIGYQARPQLFAKQIILPELLYERVVEVDERVRAEGTIEQALDLDAVRASSTQASDATASTAVAIVFMHA